MSNWIDAHLHLTDPRAAAALASLVSEAADAGIARFVLGGIEPEEWERQKRLAERFPNRFTLAFGLHPWWVASRTDREEVAAGLARLAAELDRVPRAASAIGETGLDFHPRFPADVHALQEVSFREHLRFAIRHGLPLVLHVVRAHERALEILIEERLRALNKSTSPVYRGIVHSFSESPAIGRSYLELGLTLSVSAPVITRRKGAAFEKLRQSVITLPPTAFVFETDSPDQPPAGESGLNRPANLVMVAEAVARVRAERFPGTTAAALLDQAAETVRRIFAIR